MSLGSVNSNISTQPGGIFYLFQAVHAGGGDWVTPCPYLAMHMRCWFDSVGIPSMPLGLGVTRVTSGEEIHLAPDWRK